MAVSWPPGFNRQFLGLTDERFGATISSTMAQGPAKTRRVTTVEKEYLVIPFELIGDTKKTTFDTFWANIDYGVDEFEWTSPWDDSTKIMRFRKPPKWKLVIGAENTNERYWTTKLYLEILRDA